MSVTLHLFKPLKGFEFVPPKKEDRLDFVRNMYPESKFEEFCDRTDVLSSEKWEKTYLGYIKGFDKEKHSQEYISCIGKYSPRRYSRRLLKARKRMYEQYKDYIVHAELPDRSYDCLVCEEVNYRQGWFFNRKFFNRKDVGEYYAFTKTETQRLMETYFDFKGEYKERAFEAYRAFLDTFEDGMYFAIFY